MIQVLMVLGLGLSSCMQATLVTDFGKLYPANVYSIVKPTSTQEVVAIVQGAAQQHRSVSIAGVRHSQGGQSNATGSINIDMSAMNKLLYFDKAAKTVRVQAGMSWEQLQDILHSHHLSVKIMQASNIFSIGGSVSVNVHGRDPHYGPIIESVRSMELVDGQGNIHQISRQNNPELFKLVIGGYGLFGVITAVELSVTDNCVCQKQQVEMPYQNYSTYLKASIIGHKNIQLHYARLVNIPGKNYLKKVVCVNYLKKAEVLGVTELLPETNIDKNKKFFAAYRKLWGKFFNSVRWWLEEHVVAPWEKVKVLTRNHVMRPYVHLLESGSEKQSDLLQEYFIPVHNFARFTDALRALSQQYNIKLLNVTLRFVPKNTESFLSYSMKDTIAFVLYFSIPLEKKSIQNTQQYTQRLTDACLQMGGTFYLPYQRFATHQQLLAAYPMLAQFIDLKKQYDPSDRFVSNWYEQYVTSITN